MCILETKYRLAVYKHFWSPIFSFVSRCDILDFVIIFFCNGSMSDKLRCHDTTKDLVYLSIYFVLVHVGLYLDGHLVPWQPVHLCLCWTMEVARFCHWRNVGIFDLCECGPTALIFTPLFHLRISSSWELQVFVCDPFCYPISILMYHFIGISGRDSF